MESVQKIPSPRGQIEAFLSSPTSRLCVLALGAPEERLAQDVLRGFANAGRRFLPSTYFYNALGSEIYEEITALPEYYPTRTEAAILRDAAPVIRKLLGPVRIVELGSGSSQKTRILFDAWRAQREETLYVPIDVSHSMLASTAEALVSEYRGLRVLALAGRYEEGLAALPPSAASLITFLGGTIGNFEPEQQEIFFARLSDRMSPGSAFLLGFDRRAHLKKPTEIISRAYNDEAGVTARFNLNLLTRLNQELGADFRLESFRHEAIYNEEKHQIEMYLESLAEQTVNIPALSRSYLFSKGERILTEISRKFDPEELASWFEARGFQKEAFFGDPAELFGLLLFRRI